MSGFMVWTDSLANHGSDADNRKSWDPNEGKRHYIDIDNYSEFNSTGHIASTYDSVVSIHGLNFVTSNGILPWATKTMYDSLVLAFQQHNWRAAMLHASDLGHYVGDAHQPLHVTKNYDGATQSQNGIHSRYETDMVYYNLSALDVYPGDSVHLITNVQKYIFDYIYIDYKYVDSVLVADDYAQSVAGNTTSTQYYQALYSKTGAFTKMLWYNASHALAELIYNAWVTAGSPSLTSGISNVQNDPMVISISPNPAANFLTIESDQISSIEILNLQGQLIKTYAVNNCKTSRTCRIDISSISSGVYLVAAKNSKGVAVKKFVKE